MTHGAQWQAWLQAFEWMSEAVCLVEPESLTIGYASQAAQQLLGWSAQRAVGMHVQSIAAAPQDALRWEDAQEIASAQETYTQVLHASGQVVPVAQRIQRIAGVDGRSWLLWTLSDRSQQEHSERDLEALLTELRATLDSAADGMLARSVDGSIRAFNQKFTELWRLPQALLVQRNDAAVNAHLRSLVMEPWVYDRQMASVQGEPDKLTCDILHLLDDRVIEVRSVPLLRHGGVAGRIFSYRDITQETQVQDGLRVAAQVFESSLDAIFIADARGVVIKNNPAFVQLWEGVLPAGTLASTLFADSSKDWLQEVQQSWNETGYWKGSRMLRSATAGQCAVRLSWVVTRDAAGTVQQSIGFLRDLTQQQSDQRKIEQLAFSDALTGLPNRLLLGQHVGAIIQQNQVSHFAILFLDLDRFKIINDSLGHEFGDRVLQLVAKRLQGCLRPDDVLCRLGGDEFVLYLHGCQKEHSERVACRIQEVMREPFVLDGLGFSVQCSIGMSQYPEHGRTLDELVKQADTAMYRVKANGKGSYGFYEPAMSNGLLGRMQMEHSLRQALERDDALRVVYQPQVDIASGRIVGCEALLRWTDHKLGAVSPGEFIPLAEESGYIVKIGAWVMERVVKEAVGWLKYGVAIRVSVNVSSLELHQPDFASKVGALLVSHGLPACWLELELTESALLQKEPLILRNIEHLAELGVQLAIDDFGTGYSNLAYLKSMPISRLKIDQSFVRGLPQDLSDKAIVEAVVGLGRALDVEIVAEGVETTAQCELLRQMGCDFYQGYLCAPGVDPSVLQSMLRAQSSGASSDGTTSAAARSMRV